MAEVIARSFLGIDALARSHLRKMRKINERCNQKKNGGNHQVGHFYHVCFRRDVGLNLLRTHGRSLSRSMLDSRKDKCGAHRKYQHSADRVKGLGEVEPSFRTLR